MFRGDTQASYLLALDMDLVPTELRSAVAERLGRAIEARDGPLSTGFIGVRLLCPILSEIGRSDLTYRLLLNETFPSWGRSIRHGATTIWGTLGRLDRRARLPNALHELAQPLLARIGRGMDSIAEVRSGKHPTPLESRERVPARWLRHCRQASTR